MLALALWISMDYWCRSNSKVFGIDKRYINTFFSQNNLNGKLAADKYQYIIPIQLLGSEVLSKVCLRLVSYALYSLISIIQKIANHQRGVLVIY